MFKTFLIETCIVSCSFKASESKSLKILSSNLKISIGGRITGLLNKMVKLPDGESAKTVARRGSVVSLTIAGWRF